MISFTSGSDIDIDAANSCWAALMGLRKPRSPSLAGRANILRSESLGDGFPVREGMNSDLMMFSRGKKWSPRSSMVRDKYDHSLDKPWVKAAKAACGCVVAIAESNLTSSHH